MDIQASLLMTTGSTSASHRHQHDAAASGRRASARARAYDAPQWQNTVRHRLWGAWQWLPHGGNFSNICHLPCDGDAFGAGTCDSLPTTTTKQGGGTPLFGAGLLRRSLRTRAPHTRVRAAGAAGAVFLAGVTHEVAGNELESDCE